MHDWYEEYSGEPQVDPTGPAEPPDGRFGPYRTLRQATNGEAWERQPIKPRGRPEVSPFPRTILAGVRCAFDERPAPFPAW